MTKSWQEVALFYEVSSDGSFLLTTSKLIKPSQQLSIGKSFDVSAMDPGISQVAVDKTLIDLVMYILCSADGGLPKLREYSRILNYIPEN